jgi:hypothetical protein
MTRRSKIWLAVDAIFIVANVVGGISAIANGEVRHAGGHLVLVALGVAVAWLFAPKDAVDIASTADLTDSLTRLQHSLDAVAVEVERIGEGQRYVTHLMNEDAVSPVSESPPPGRVSSERPEQ